jgi:exonuclease SbcD
VKILHTSDWHLGATFHDRVRDADEEHALDQIVAVARNRLVDAVVISGDIFETANPGAAEQRRWYQILQRLVDEAGVGTVVAIAGNHDSGLRLEGPRELLASHRVQVRGLLMRDAEPMTCMVPIHDRAGVHRAHCALVPYLREGDLLRVGDEVGEDRPQRLARALHRRWGEVRAAIPGNLPWIAVSHAFAKGGRVGGAESPVLVEVGNLGNADISTLADGCSYAAIGHLHQPQSIGGREHWRYSGALLPTGFDEAGLQRSVVLADIPVDGSPASIELVPLNPYRDYRRVAGSLELVQTTLRSLSQPLAGAPTPWLQAIVHLSTPVPGLARILSEAADTRGWNCVSTQILRGGEAAGTPGLSGTTGVMPPELDAILPTEVFRLLHQHLYNTDPPSALAQSFSDLLATIQSQGN